MSCFIIVIMAFVIWTVKVQDTIKWFRVAQCWVFCHNTHICIYKCVYVSTCKYSCASKSGPHSKHISSDMLYVYPGIVPWFHHDMYGLTLLKSGYNFLCQPRNDLNLVKSKENQWCAPDSSRLSFEFTKIAADSCYKMPNASKSWNISFIIFPNISQLHCFLMFPAKPTL